MRSIREPLVYGLLAFLLYSANGRPIATGDSLPARFLPFAILAHGTVWLDPVANVARAESPPHYWIEPTRDGHLASLFPIVTPLLVTPLYVPAVTYLSYVGWTDARLRAMGAIMEKVAASIVASAAVALMFVLLRRSTTLPTARLLTLAFAAGTATWPISSQALWQHGVGEVSLLVALVAMTAAPTASRVVLAGGAVGVLAANRPLDGLFALALGLYAVRWARGRLPEFVGAAAVPVILAYGYNLRAFGDLWGGYGARDHFSLRYFSHPILEGIAGLLVSPGKGLFVYSPFLLALFARNPFRGHPHARLAAYLSVAVALQVALYAAADWRAGWSYGCRFLTDTLPVLTWLLSVPVAAFTRPARVAFIAAVGVAIGIQAIGAFKYIGWSSQHLYEPGQAWRFERAWSPRDSPILFEARQPWASMTLLDEMAKLP